MNLSKRLAEHLVTINYEDLPEKAIEASKKCILDTIGVILAANTLGEGCQSFVNITLADGGNEQSTIFGFGQKVPASAAAFANGAMAHSMDFGESHDTAFVHASAPTVPAALAVAEALDHITGKDLITAVTLGNDLVCRLGLSITKNLLEYGWYMPPILGAFGATAAAGKLLHLTEEQMLDAFSLTLCQATCSAEITRNPQTLIRSVRDAFAAKAGVTSALLAKEGVKGFDQPFDGERAFFYSFTRGHFDSNLLMKNLGKQFEGTNVSFKPWPSCRGTHPYIECLLNLLKKYQLDESDVIEMRAVVSEVNQMLICEPLEGKRKPEGAINAKFSLPYVLATTLVHGKVTLEQFTEQSILEPIVLANAQKVKYKVNSNLTLKESLQGYLEIETKDGEVYSEKIERPYGNPLHPMSNEEMIEKFKDCGKYSKKRLTDHALNKVIEQIFHLETIKDVREFTKLL
ncbi:MmgE/PrpD family protein [Halalkalibacter krulwichiae]|uniref:2-methylcitrate dehydratase n=1 Tax=Halalkalibacter krulwichiae TaxID=199441 RepID=A0A1X9M928_9BACI|nr:MmgE/PrpD family protein [Halalkalibacter krulwichiae]ARK29925.1 2-methylcitrate dehydratase [Halalkalibacter krulwichiae]